MRSCLKRDENMFPKRFYLNDHDSLIHNSSNLEIAQIFIHRKMDKQFVVYPCNEIVLLNKKKELLITFNNMGESPKHC